MNPNKDGMEVEIKLRLLGREAHEKVLHLMKDGAGSIYKQENYFFDGSQQELSTLHHVLRVRFYNTDQKCSLTLKGKAAIEGGVGRALEVEHTIEPSLGRNIVSNPSTILKLDMKIPRMIRDKFAPQDLVCLGKFDNIRQEIQWGGTTLELDETRFEWGTLYELECETQDPDSLKQELESTLAGNGIPYKYCSVSKFSNFVNKTLL